jgi:hypothetical protein
VTLPTWERQPVLRRNYARLVRPEGKIEDIWRGWLDGALEASDEPLQVFTSQNDWNLFLQHQREIVSEWNLRNTFTECDRCFLAELKVAWEPETMRHARWRASHGHDEDFLFRAAD